MEIKRLNHIAIATSKFEETIQFYRDVLGFTGSDPSPERGLRMIFLYGKDGVNFEIVELGPGEENSCVFDGKNHIAFDVDDVKRVQEELTKKGVPLLCEMEDLPAFHTRVIKIRDPNHIVIALRQNINI